jgi:hypothetical protein
MKRLTITISLCLVHIGLIAQYAPQAGVTGSTAVHKSSGLFTGWATGCTINRGYQDIADKSKGYTSTGDESLTVGKPDITVASLGDSGVATLTFSHPIYNGTGADFAVFENGFANPANPEEAFLELAFVEVSSDGQRFVRFPSSSLTPVTTQIPVAGVYNDARNLHNLAGKYIGNYGTPFDLEELKDSVGLDVNNITHVRLVDVIGDINVHKSYDKDGKVINDPYPTSIPTGGFDLDAVGAFHQHGLFPASVNPLVDVLTGVYPNPTTDKFQFSLRNANGISYTLTDVMGKAVIVSKPATDENHIDLSGCGKGIYYLVLADTDGNKWVERITKL